MNESPALDRIPKLAKPGGLLIFSALVAGLLVRDAAKESADREARFQAREHAVAEAKALEVERFFGEFYKSLRAISLIPPVRDVDARNLPAGEEDAVALGWFSEEGHDVVQQFYNNLALTVPVSEVYMTLDGFDPEAGETPFFMYDSLVLGGNASGEEGALEDFPEEEEEEEYEVLQDQLAAVRGSHPRFAFEDFDQIPALLSQSVRTCDNTQYYSRSDHDVADAHGHVYSVPVYRQDGSFSGLLSAIFRTNQLEALLLGVPFVVVTDADAQRAEAEGWSMPEVARFALVAPGRDLVIADRRNAALADRAASAPVGAGESSSRVPIGGMHAQEGAWELVYEYDMGALSAELQEVQDKRNFRLLGLLVVTLGAMVFLIRDQRSQDRIGEALSAAQAANDSLNVVNREMRLVLDSMREGLATLDPQGLVGGAVSRAFGRLVGHPEQGLPLHAHLEEVDPCFSGCLEMGLESLSDGFLPAEVVMDQLPDRLRADGRTLAVRYLMLGEEDAYDGVLLTFEDVTERELAEQEAREEQEVLQLIKGLIRDPRLCRSFLADAGDKIHALESGEVEDRAVQLRILHTLKGNCALMGLEVVAGMCHHLESWMVETGQEPRLDQLQELTARWAVLTDAVAALDGEEQGDRVWIPRLDLESLVDELEQRGQESMARQVRAWSMEQVEVEFTRQGERAQTLAERLGRGEVEIEIVGGGVRFEEQSWRPFWSSLAHLVRNCVDHGLPPVAAAEPGYTPVIFFRASAQDGSVVFEVGDNGRGIDWEGLGQALSRRGLPHTTRAERIEGLFMDGVSSREEVTDTSGRGIGMAAVRQIVQSRGGQIQVHSEPGQGTRFVFTFPADESIAIAAPIRALQAA